MFVDHLFMNTNFGTMRGEIFNVGLSTANLSKWNFVRKLLSMFPDLSSLNTNIIKIQTKRNYIVSNAKIEATGFEPAYSSCWHCRTRKGLYNVT